jgi:hypothetical protein
MREYAVILEALPIAVLGGLALAKFLPWERGRPSASDAGINQTHRVIEGSSLYGMGPSVEQGEIDDWAPDPMYLGTGDLRDPQVGIVDSVEAAGNSLAWMNEFGLEVLDE